MSGTATDGDADGTTGRSGSRLAWVAIAGVLDLALVGFMLGVMAGRLDWTALPPELATAFLAAVAAGNAKSLGRSPTALLGKLRRSGK